MNTNTNPPPTNTTITDPTTTDPTTIDTNTILATLRTTDPKFATTAYTNLVQHHTPPTLAAPTPPTPTNAAPLLPSNIQAA